MAIEFFAIVNTDNFGGDYPDEKFLLQNLSEKQAERIAAVINQELSGDHAPRFWKVVKQPYTLQGPFEP